MPWHSSGRASSLADLWKWKKAGSTKKITEHKCLFRGAARCLRGGMWRWLQRGITVLGTRGLLLSKEIFQYRRMLNWSFPPKIPPSHHSLKLRAGLPTGYAVNSAFPLPIRREQQKVRKGDAACVGDRQNENSKHRN